MNIQQSRLIHIHFLSHLTTDGAAVIFALSLFIPFLLCLLFGRPQHTHSHAPYHGVIALGLRLRFVFLLFN